MVEKFIKILLDAFGAEVTKSIIIITTFGNIYEQNLPHYNNSDYKKIMDEINLITKKYEVAGGVVDFRGSFQLKG